MALGAATMELWLAEEEVGTIKMKGRGHRQLDQSTLRYYSKKLSKRVTSLDTGADGRSASMGIARRTSYGQSNLNKFSPFVAIIVAFSIPH